MADSAKKEKAGKPAKSTVVLQPHNRYIKLKPLNSSALAVFFYVNIYDIYCCIMLRFT